ncbi:MAG TPA: cyanophycin synthetase [Terriglobia bacterium]|nr:cyanophycin synthetase [Terriglobia bacterium]
MFATSRLLQFYGYAIRAKRLLGKTRAQSLLVETHRLRFYEDVWREAAVNLGAQFEVLGGGILKISGDGASVRVHTNCTPLDDPVTLQVALNKILVHNILRSHGLPTPDHAEFTLNTLDKAYRFLDRHQRCVVKPAEGTDGGGGVTTGIETRSHLIRAAARAAGYSSKFLVEEQVQGKILRLLYLDGRLLDAVKRSSPTVVGDGKSRISQLVFGLNQKRIEAGYGLAQVTLKFDMDMERTLAQQGLSWRSIPARGRRVTLKTVVNDNMADENESVAGQIAESIVGAGRRAAELVGARLAGVDVITTDVGRGLEEAGGKILEVNTTPGYHYHYFKRDGACRVAVPILMTCLERAGGRKPAEKRYA